MLNKASTSVPWLTRPCLACRLWAAADVEDESKRTAVIPELRFVRGQAGTDTGGHSAGSSPVTIAAKDVLLFRVDSLEGGAVGCAVLIKEWRVL